MSFIKTPLIHAAFFAALVCSAVAVSPSTADAGPKTTGGILGVSGLDLGSGR